MVYTWLYENVLYASDRLILESTDLIYYIINLVIQNISKKRGNVKRSLFFIQNKVIPYSETTSNGISSITSL